MFLVLPFFYNPHTKKVYVTEDEERAAAYAESDLAFDKGYIWFLAEVTPLSEESEPEPACGLDVGQRPYWMGIDQYDPCPCVRKRGHLLEHECVHGHTR